MSEIKFLLTREVKAPSRANKFDAGIDFFVPTFNDQFIEDLKSKNPNLNISIEQDSNGKYFLLSNLERVLIPSGIKYKMESPGRALIANNKSGIATKQGLLFGASVCDYEYQGEVHISLFNVSKECVKIYEGMKIIQFIETPVINSDILIVNSESELFNGLNTTRGAGGFGSSDYKDKLTKLGIDYVQVIAEGSLAPKYTIRFMGGKEKIINSHIEFEEYIKLLEKEING